MALQLMNFDNLSKTLTCCIYTMCYTDTEHSKKEFIEYINRTYSSTKIKDILEKISNIINANILYITEYDYIPYGASVNILTSDSQIDNKKMCAHLDKSHIAVHTYPEISKETKVSYVRIDLEISSCGNISPLDSLETVVEYFNPDIFIYDFKIRGVTKTKEGVRRYSYDNLKKNIRTFNKKQAYRYQIIKCGRYQSNGLEISMLKKKIKYADCLDRKDEINIDMFDSIYREAKKIVWRRR